MQIQPETGFDLRLYLHLAVNRTIYHDWLAHSRSAGC